MKSIRNHYPQGYVMVASDLLVLNVTPTSIMKRKAVVSDYAWYPASRITNKLAEPKYHDSHGNTDPTAQIDTTDVIPSGTDKNGNQTYDASGC